MRIIFDANVLVSALISPKGAPARLWDLWESEAYELVISPLIYNELERVVTYPKIQEKYKLPEENVQQFLKLIQGRAIVVEPNLKNSAIMDVDTANRYLECAINGEASYIVTGDKHLLVLKDYLGIPILPPAVFLTLLESGSLDH